MGRATLLASRSSRRWRGTTSARSASRCGRDAPSRRPRTSALGRRIRYGRDASARWLSIVGVTRDIKQGSLGGAVQDQVYVPYAARYPWSDMSFVVRTPGDPMSVVPLVRAELRQLDPTVPLTNVMLMQALVDRSIWDRRLYGTMFTLFASIALLLAAI